MAKIDKLSFGSIVIDGKKYSRDVLIFADGSKEKKGWLFDVRQPQYQKRGD